MNSPATLFGIAALLYGASFAAAFASFLKRGEGGGFWFFALAFAGFVAHTSALGVVAARCGRLPVYNSYELLEAIAWMIVAVDLSAAAVLRVKILGSLTALAACALTALPLMCPVFSEKVCAAEPTAGDLAAVHAAVAIVAYSFIALSSFFGCMYVLQRRSLKTRANDAFSRALLPLPRLVRFARRSLGAACLAMAASAGLGIAAAAGSDPSPVMWAKFAAGFFLFAAMLALLAFSSRLSELAFSRLCVAMFALAIFLLIPIQLRTVFL